jgi:hypothetical protein
MTHADVLAAPPGADRPPSDGGRPRGISVCPHCWGVGRPGIRLCGRCGADTSLLLQESGGLRRTAPVQSPVPVGVRHRLSLVQRLLVLGVLAALAAVHVLGALAHDRGRPGLPLSHPLGPGVPAPAGRAADR